MGRHHDGHAVVDIAANQLAAFRRPHRRLDLPLALHDIGGLCCDSFAIAVTAAASSRREKHGRGAAIATTAHRRSTRVSVLVLGLRLE